MLVKKSLRHEITERRFRALIWSSRLKVCGYEITRQAGSHIRLTTIEKGSHHITIPNHDPIKIETLGSILDDISDHLGISRQELLIKLNL